MRSPGLARAKPEFGGIDRFNAEEFQTDNSADNIDNGIHCAHFVEVNRVNGRAVNFGFGFGEFLKNAPGAFLGRGRYRTAVDDFEDVLQVAVNVAFPCVDIDFRAGDAVFFQPAVEKCQTRARRVCRVRILTPKKKGPHPRARPRSCRR